jgi:NAD(P)-dependent dehydrogenase (short-subunit alcohol dehydrogenase family)
MTSLSGKRVLITGASSGVGCAAAEAFACQGCSVALVARNRDGLERVAARARAHGVPAHPVVADLADRAAVDAAVAEAVRAMGGLDVLVANAASMAFGRFWEVDQDTFDATIANTFFGAVYVVRAALPHLAADGGGALVATGSVMARVPLPTFCSYAAAKHALRGWLNSLRIELKSAKVPVTVSMVHPGAVDTPLWDHLTSGVGRLPNRPPDRYRPEEVARAIVSVAASGREEFTVGGEARAMEVLYSTMRPLANRVLAVVARFYNSGRGPAPSPGMVFRASGEGECSGGGRWARPSLWTRLRLRVP